MKGILRFLFGNWGLKLLALALALIIYHSLSGSHRDSTNDRTFFQKR